MKNQWNNEWFCTFTAIPKCRPHKILKEKLIIDGYLPAQLDETALNLLIDNAVKQMGIDTVTKQDMGKIIGAVKAKGGAEVDGAMLAKLVQARIQA